MKRIPWLALLGLSACSSSNARDDAFVCEPATDRVGTYWFTADEISGDCGPMNAGLVRVERYDALGVDCQLTLPDAISEQGCKLERTYSCELESGSIGQFTAVTAQQDAAGAVLTGTVSAQIEFASGEFCASSYRVRYERQ